MRRPFLLRMSLRLPFLPLLPRSAVPTLSQQSHVTRLIKPPKAWWRLSSPDSSPINNHLPNHVK